jgi:hypothetical protein
LASVCVSGVGSGTSNWRPEFIFSSAISLSVCQFIELTSNDDSLIVEVPRVLSTGDSSVVSTGSDGESSRSAISIAVLDPEVG